jgi:hypothetical protein
MRYDRVRLLYWNAFGLERRDGGELGVSLRRAKVRVEAAALEGRQAVAQVHRR